MKATAALIKQLEEDVANLREEVEALRECRYFHPNFSHAGCRHAEAPPGAVHGPGIHWSNNLDDAFCDLDNYGGYLLREDARYVVVECATDGAALRLRTIEQYDALEKAGWSEVPLPEGV